MRADLGGDRLDEEGADGSCIICFGDFTSGERLCRLPCLHLYHAKVCVWLQAKKLCRPLLSVCSRCSVCVFGRVLILPSCGCSSKPLVFSERCLVADGSVRSFLAITGLSTWLCCIYDLPSSLSPAAPCRRWCKQHVCSFLLNDTATTVHRRVARRAQSPLVSLVQDIRLRLCWGHPSSYLPRHGTFHQHHYTHQHRFKFAGQP